MRRSVTAGPVKSGRCPICHTDAFLPAHGRLAARCTGCGALERHRGLVRACWHQVTRGLGRSALDVAPYSPEVYGGFLQRHGWRCTRIDKWRTGNPYDPRAVGFIDHEVDLVDMSLFGRAAFDLIVVQHVIEEIPHFRSALAELARVLRPNGAALLEIPWHPEAAVSEQHPPDRFGNVWRFGRDLPDALARVFGQVDLVTLSEAGYRGQLFVCRH